MRAIEKTRRCVAGWAACLVAIATVAGGARAQDPDAVPGRIEGTGTHFEVTDSEWKNVTLDSTEVIDLRLLSAPAIIEMGVGAAAGVTSAELTLSGLDPTTTYYKYEDDWHGLQQVTTDAAGALLFTQDLSQWHRVSIVTAPSTVFLGENGWTVGGLPWSYGTWDPVTRTATLTATPPQGHLPLQIDIDNVTLDGQGVVLTKINVGSQEAILVSDRTGVTIRNVVIASTREFGSGVRLVRCEACVVEDCDVTVNARYAKGVVVQDSNDCVVRNNSLSSPQPSGYAVHLNRYQKKGTTSARNTISGNAIQNSRNGILLDSGAPGTTDNVVTGNTLTGIGYGWGIGVRYPTTGSIVSGNTVSNFKEGVVVTSNGMLWDAVTVEDNVVTGNYLGLRLQSTIGNLVTRNTLSSNSVGLDAYNSHNNQVYRNNFLKNGTQATVYGMSSGNVFSLELPVGGNHWSNWTKPDLDADGFVDAPYLFNSGQQDALPWVVADAWANQPPVTVLTADKTKAHPGDTVTFDGSGSSDPDGDPLTYQWTLAAPMGSNAKLVPVTMDSSKVQLQVDAWGSYVVSLLVIDDSGAGGAQVSLMVGMVNLPPVPVADDQLAHPGNIVMLDGSASWDPEMDYPLTYNWFLSGPAGSMAVMNDATSQTAWFVPDVWGDYNVRLYVTDSLGEKGGPRNVLVSMTNTAPVAFAGDDQAIIQLGTLVHLDGTESYDDDGDSISYWWMLGSAPMGSMAVLDDPTSPTPTFVANVHGDYVVHLAVTDLYGATSMSSSLTVSFDNVAPVADAGANQAVVAGDPVMLSGSYVDANLDPCVYAWSFASIPSGSQANLASTTTAETLFIADVPGTYVASLVVYDGFEFSVPANVTVTAISVQLAATQKVGDAMGVISTLPPTDFKNRTMAKALTNKLGSVLGLVDVGYYQEAVDKLDNDLLKKMDGYATTGGPDKNDWIQSGMSQAAVAPLLKDARDLLSGL